MTQSDREVREHQVKLRKSYVERARRHAEAEGVPMAAIFERGLDLLEARNRRAEPKPLAASA